MKKLFAFLVIIVMIMSICIVLQAGGNPPGPGDACHKKCASRYPDSLEKYLACMYGCMPQ